jgi:hypothetical protein
MDGEGEGMHVVVRQRAYLDASLDEPATALCAAKRNMTVREENGLEVEKCSRGGV